MANPEHVGILNRGAVAWNEWRRSNTTIEPDLSKAHLRRADLRALDLTGTYLFEAGLRGALLKTLAGANLTGADLDGATLRDATRGAAFDVVVEAMPSLAGIVLAATLPLSRQFYLLGLWLVLVRP